MLSVRRPPPLIPPNRHLLPPAVKHKRYPVVFRPEEIKSMTVCIAAACEGGERIVTASDGLFSLGDVTGETVLAKMLWLGDWQFMYAGIPANFSMVYEEITTMGLEDPDVLSRRRVQETIRQAFRRVCARYASFEHLLPFNMTIDEFKKDGLAVFGESYFGELLRQISNTGAKIQDQILVTGWGHSPYSAMIYEVGPTGDWLHTAAGFAAIGRGSQMAQTMLVLLGQARHRTLSETIFNVACAKFNSEKSTDPAVGQNTAIYVSRKRPESDESAKLTGDFLEQDDINELREFWHRHLRPRIPDESRVAITRIASKFNNGTTSGPGRAVWDRVFLSGQA